MKEFLPEDLSEFLERTGNLLIHLLDKCNLRCKHCYLDASKNGRYMLPLDLVKRTINEAQDLGMASIQFSGGEPFLYPYIREVLESTNGENTNLTLSTNGTLIDNEAAELLAKIGAYVITSIDGPETYHDMFRGQKGAFAKARASIARLVDLSVPVKIVTTICENSFEHIDWIAEWAHGMKVDILQFQPLESTGRGKEIENNRLSEARLHELFIRLNDLAVSYSSKGPKISMTYQSRDIMIEHPCRAFVCNGKNCHRGVERELKNIVIREDGLVLPELVDIDRRFSMGNIHRDTLKNIILNYLNDGYARFDQLCREVYNDTVLNYPVPLIPWNEILAERSRTFKQSVVKDNIVV